MHNFVIKRTKMCKLNAGKISINLIYFSFILYNFFFKYLKGNIYFWQNCIFGPSVYLQFWIWSPSNLIHELGPSIL